MDIHKKIDSETLEKTAKSLITKDDLLAKKDKFERAITFYQTRLTEVNNLLEVLK